MKPEKIQRLLQSNGVDESKLNKYVNDLLKDNDISPKGTKEVDTGLILRMFKCVTSDWRTECDQLVKTEELSGKISLGNLKITLKKLILKYL
jgi:hypothetical protein